MNAAKVGKSKRLQAVLRCLRDGAKTTRQLLAESGMCAINSIVAELRANGYVIRCSFRERTESGQSVYLYRLIRK